MKQLDAPRAFSEQDESSRTAPAETSRSRRFRSSIPRPGGRRLLTHAAQVLIVLVVLVAWERLSGNPSRGTGVLDEFFVGKPSKIWHSLTVWGTNGVLLQAAWVTVQETIAGFVLGSVIGLVLGFTIGINRVLSDVFAPLVYAAYSIPRLALVPMFILWFGLGMQSKIALVTLLVFFLTFFNTYAGAREVDEELIAVTRIMNASRLQVIQKVILPSAVVWVTLGLQISVPYAFVGAIVGEIIAGNQGLGQLISSSSNQFDPNGMFAAIAVAVVLSVLLNGVVSLASGYFLRWRSGGGQDQVAPAI